MSEPIPLYTLPLAEYVVLDIETGNAPEDAIQRAMAAWEPPANIRDEAKIDARRAEAEARIRERAALLDAAPILCVAAKTQAQMVLLNGMDLVDHQVDGVMLFSCGTERDMLLALRTWLDTLTTADTLLVNHRLINFDLPHLRGRYAWHRLRLPECLQTRMSEAEKQPACDTQIMYRAFSVEHRDGFASLGAMAIGLGVPSHKSIVDGSQIPRLFAAGEYLTILQYNVLDVLTTESCWLRMMSEGNDLE